MGATTTAASGRSADDNRSRQDGWAEEGSGILIRRWRRRLLNAPSDSADRSPRLEFLKTYPTVDVPRDVLSHSHAFALIILYTYIDTSMQVKSVETGRGGGNG